MLREKIIQDWLQQCYPSQAPTLSAVGADASFRRYFRTHLPNGEHYIVMDAPPQYEDCKPFVRIAEILTQHGVNVPKIWHADIDNGILVLTDFGDVTYLAALTAECADELYDKALDTLVKIQLCQYSPVLLEYSRELLDRELRLFDEWYVARHLGVTLRDDENKQLQQVYALLLDNALGQSQVLVHRDYHSRNLMVTSSDPGVLDFQDAVFGPITYDLVSLLRDAYIDWDEAQVLDWVIRYWEKARRSGLPVPKDFGVFYRDFEWMGLQRHLKVLGIFARLNYRDGKAGYLQDMPRVLAYVQQVAGRYREFGPLKAMLDRWQGASKETAYSF